MQVAHQERDSHPVDVTARDEKPGQKRKRAPAADLMLRDGKRRNSMGAAGLPAASATPPQPKRSHMEQMLRSASAEAHAPAGTDAAAALADTPADLAGAGAAPAMQAALAREQPHHTGPSKGQQSRQAGVDAARAWQGQNHQPDAILQEGCAMPDSTCMALQVSLAPLEPSCHN